MIFKEVDLQIPEVREDMTLVICTVLVYRAAQLIEF